MWGLLAQTAPGKAAVQHTAPVANDIEWWVLALCIAASAAVLTFGLGRVTRFAFDGTNREKLWEMLSRLGLVLLCTIFGAIAGWRVWDAWLGGLAGAVGSGASPMFMRYLIKLTDRFIDRVAVNAAKRQDKNTDKEE